MVTAVRSTASPAVHAAASATGRPTLRVLQALGHRPDPQSPAVAREATAQFAADLFFAPLLAEMRRFPMGQDFAHGGPAEAIFGEQLDQRIADQVALQQPGLVEAILRQIEGRAGRAPGEGRIR